jgi:hypothetical protein
MHLQEFRHHGPEDILGLLHVKNVDVVPNALPGEVAHSTVTALLALTTVAVATTGIFMAKAPYGSSRRLQNRKRRD